MEERAAGTVAHPALKANRDAIRASVAPVGVSVASIAAVSIPEQVTRVPPIDESVRFDARRSWPQFSPFVEQTPQRLLRHRSVFLGERFADEIASRFVGELLLLSAEDR